MSDEKQQTEVARFYTRSRKFPRLIGRLHDGTKIPGGPYTVTQAIVAAYQGAAGSAVPRAYPHAPQADVARSLH